ncbi:MAG TPA: GDSL-type esterase/lipase family protein, partial [Candidatus Saccharimonadales bacterium]|nr:GDSL-type esterase/lipase family protein [Candidatus Saccharimonadales bacterium]
FYVGQANKSSDQASRAVLDKTGQTDQYLASFTPGYIDQLDFAKTYQPKVITVSVGGNDMGFSSILYSCVAPWKTGTCYNTYESRLELVNLINTTVFNNLVQTYDALKNAGSPDMRIYVVGYPQIAKPDGNCGLNVHLNNDEIKFSQLLIDYLDTVIQQAAAKTGVYYVDTQDALNGHRLCEAGPGSVAMNGFTVGKDRPASFGPIGDESYHPNPTGYQLMENKVLSATNNLTKTMSAPNLNAAPPAIDGQPILDVPHDDSTIKTVQYDPSITADLAYAGATTDISINGPSEGLSSYSPLQAELHSTPIDLGNYTTNADGDLNAQITIPSDTPAGYHTLHFYGTNIADQPVDIYKFIYIAASAEDMDGDGMPDDQQACIGVTSSGQDYDQDGIDDACDADISLPPLVSTAAVQTSSAKPTSQPQPLPVLASNPPGPDASYQSGDPDPGQPTQSQPVTLAEHTTAPVAAMPNSKPSTKPGNAKYFVIAGAIIFLLAIATALKWLV